MVGWSSIYGGTLQKYGGTGEQWVPYSRMPQVRTPLKVSGNLGEMSEEPS